MEGESDDFILSFLAERILPEIEFVEALVYQGRTRLRRSLPGLLKAFRFGAQKGAVPILHRDSNGRDVEHLERELREFCPPEVSLVIPVQETQAWLLADQGTLKRHFPGCLLPQGSPETLVNAKEILRQLASQSNVALTKERLGSLLQEIDLAVVEDRCPSFKRFIGLLENLATGG